MSEKTRKIVVGYDGSPASRRALEYAADRAGPDGQVIVVNCFGPPPDWLGAPNYQRVLDDHEERGRALLEAIPLETDSVLETEWETELIGGHPADAIVDVAKTRDADEIVIGSRGFGRLRGALGSVSHEVLHLADRPVVVMPHAETDQH